MLFDMNRCKFILPNKILTNDYYASLRASYTFKELKNFTLENDLSSLDVFEEGDNYLIVYGNV